MKIICTKDYEHMSCMAANMISAQITLKPDSVLGLATGGSPVGIYKRLVEWYESGNLDLRYVKTVNLDEYEGLPKDNSNSYAAFMRDHLFSHVNILPENIHIPDGTAVDQKAECRRYDSVLQALGGIDLQLLGIGANGHIGFNEPDNVFSGRTHLVELAGATIEANQRFFTGKEEVPRFAYTMGIYDIMQSGRIIMVASGRTKAGIIRKAFAEPVNPRVPASILQFHRDFTLVADEDALSELKCE